MARPDTMRGSELLITVGDGNSPEQFVHPCSINTERGIQFDSQGSDVVVPDCDNPEDPAWLEHVKDGLSATINGAGTLDRGNLEMLDEWFRSPLPRNVRVVTGNIGTWEGAFHLTSYQVTGTRTEKAQVTLNLRSEGVILPYNIGT